MTDGSVFSFVVVVVVWFLRKIRPTQLWIELGCGKKIMKADFQPFSYFLQPAFIRGSLDQPLSTSLMIRSSHT